VNISNQLIGYIHSNHVPQAKRAYLVVSETDSKKKPAFSNGDKINATIIFINPYARVVYLSLLPHLIDSTKNAKIMDLFTNNRSEDSLKLGQILDDVQVNMHTHKGIFVKFNGDFQW
jgi:ribosomal protein S1